MQSGNKNYGVWSVFDGFGRWRYARAINGYTLGTRPGFGRKPVVMANAG